MKRFKTVFETIDFQTFKEYNNTVNNNEKRGSLWQKRNSRA